MRMSERCAPCPEPHFLTLPTLSGFICAATMLAHPSTLTFGSTPAFPSPPVVDSYTSCTPSYFLGGHTLTLSRTTFFAHKDARRPRDRTQASIWSTSLPLFLTLTEKC
jgi:hypothetical protein